MNDDQLDTGVQQEGPFPATIEADTVTFDVKPSGELETTVTKPDGETIVQYSMYPDSVYEQLVELEDLA